MSELDIKKLNLKVLLVDDEPDILELIKYNLEKEGYTVKTASNGKKALDVAAGYLPDIVILDIMMPVLDGVETCRKIREMPALKGAYVLFLTARSEEFSEVAAFEAGADDYVTKPIKPRALTHRIKAYYRRTAGSAVRTEIIEVGDLKIDRESYTVHKAGKPIDLPKKEFDLLSFLAANPNKVFERDHLLESVWGSGVYVLPRTVDVHIRKVREKIGDDYIKTVKGVGYKFKG